MTMSAAREGAKLRDAIIDIQRALVAVRGIGERNPGFEIVETERMMQHQIDPLVAAARDMEAEEP